MEPHRCKFGPREKICECEVNFAVCPSGSLFVCFWPWDDCKQGDALHTKQSWPTTLLASQKMAQEESQDSRPLSNNNALLFITNICRNVKPKQVVSWPVSLGAEWTCCLTRFTTLLTQLDVQSWHAAWSQMVTQYRWNHSHNVFRAVGQNK